MHKQSDAKCRLAISMGYPSHQSFLAPANLATLEVDCVLVDEVSATPIEGIKSLKVPWQRYFGLVAACRSLSQLVIVGQPSIMAMGQCYLRSSVVESYVVAVGTEHSGQLAISVLFILPWGLLGYVAMPNNVRLENYSLVSGTNSESPSP